MPAYVTLFNFTEQGIQNVKDSPERAKAAAKALERMGGRFIGIWWLVGQYDGMVIMEAPNDEIVTQFAMLTGMQGNIRTTTMRAFGEDEVARLIGGLP